MKMTIYMPEDLAEMVKEHADLNVSAVCQKALREELARREELAKLAEGMQRIVVYVETVDGREVSSDVAFVGKELYYGSHPQELTAYLTQQKRLAVYSHDAQALYTFDSFDDLTDDPAWRDGEPELVAAVAIKLGKKYVIELDI